MKVPGKSVACTRINLVFRLGTGHEDKMPELLGSLHTLWYCNVEAATLMLFLPLLQGLAALRLGNSDKHSMIHVGEIQVRASPI